MKKVNVIDKISLWMMNDEVKDEVLIEIISKLDDLNEVGSDGRTLLTHSSFYKRQKVAEWLVSKGVDLNIKDKVGYTALHAAAQERNIETAKLLLLNGANVNARDSFGNSPIFRARYDDLPMIELLMKHGADCMADNDYGVSAYRSFQAYPDVIEIMDRYRS